MSYRETSPPLELMTRGDHLAVRALFKAYASLNFPRLAYEPSRMRNNGIAKHILSNAVSYLMRCYLEDSPRWPSIPEDFEL